MRVAIHQPEYLPCFALVAKAARCDLFVLLDDVQFNRASLQQRARIVGADGAPRWLTIPFVHRFPQRIDEVEIAGREWTAQHAAILSECYGRAPAFASVFTALAPVLDPDAICVAAVAAASMRAVFHAFDVTLPTVRSSDLRVGGQRGDRVLAICRAVSATTYVAGRAGATYLDAEAFAAAGIGIEVSQFAVPPYERVAPLPAGTAPEGLSALDAWAHLGDGAAAWLRGAL